MSRRIWRSWPVRFIARPNFNLVHVAFLAVLVDQISDGPWGAPHSTLKTVVILLLALVIAFVGTWVQVKVEQAK